MVRYKIKNPKIKKIVFFRADWNNSIGYGHYKRTLNLANLFVKEGHKSFILTTSTIEKSNKKKNIKIIKIKNDIQAVEILKKKKLDLIIMDIEHYKQNIRKLNSIYQNYSKIGVPIICWDYVFKTNFPFNAIYRPYPDIFNFPKNPNVKFYFRGFDYLNLKKKKNLKKKSFNIKNILITFGAAYKLSFLKKVIKIIEEKNTKINYHIILKKFILQKSLSQHRNIYFHNFFSDIETAIKSLQIDLAITNNGMTKYELSNLGIPSLVLLERKGKFKINYPKIKKNFGFVFTNLKNFEKNLFKILENKKLFKRLSQNIFFKNCSQKNIVNSLIGINK